MTSGHDPCNRHHESKDPQQMRLSPDDDCATGIKEHVVQSSRRMVELAVHVKTNNHRSKLVTLGTTFLQIEVLSSPASAK